MPRLRQAHGPVRPAGRRVAFPLSVLRPCVAEVGHAERQEAGAARRPAAPQGLNSDAKGRPKEGTCVDPTRSMPAAVILPPLPPVALPADACTARPCGRATQFVAQKGRRA